MARRQTAGRGRRGREWTAPAGNLNATLLLRPELPPADAARLSFVAALALAEVFRWAVPEAHVALKWPNDVLLNGGKAAGILLESEGGQHGLDWMAIGCGLNLVAHPPAAPDAATPPTSVAAAGGVPPKPEDALCRLARSFDRHFQVYRSNGFAPVRDAWLSQAARLGGRVEARLPNETVAGDFVDLDESGALVLHTAAGMRRISAADVHFP